MATRKHIAALALAASALLVGSVATAAPAAAINRVNGSACQNRDDFFAAWNDGKVCFANSGSVAVNIYDVWQVTTGANAGQYSYATQDGRYATAYPAQWVTWKYSPKIMLTNITIR
ncbi:MULTISPECIES: beta/gamma crystallin domain-containing protein [Streptomyces]|uniref:Streptomyces killer toxin-like beta/gamma crystallin domain-containing protein n=1 Tax=Streptomyces siderophoricus TaxID=2802281 RepID=A0ABS1N289_9ACTN|nr:beta/gamma crystallin domain-containing protein [Streptomyces sp. 9-7]MBL1094016.1 hypothetical protein [Streptomyces sp. 9-7]